MNKLFFVILLLFLLTSCGGGYKVEPERLNNACSIVRERPEYLRAFRETERRWGVPVHVQMATMYQESKFVSNARPPYRYVLGIIPMGRQSTAFGYSQALDGTWDEYRAKTRNRWARRDRIDDAADFMGWYMSASNRSLNIPLTDARNQYLAYHEGRTGYRRGSHRKKDWLLRVSSNVQSRASMYQQQLVRCNVERFA